MCAVVAFSAACSGGSGRGRSTHPLTVTVVSTRPDMVTGGDVLLSVGDGRDTTTPVTAVVRGRTVPVSRLRAWWRVSGLPDGASTIEVRRGNASGSVRVVGHSIKGPVFSGPHPPLLACSTEHNGLGPPTDADCSAPTKVDYLYGRAGTLKSLPDPAALPADHDRVDVGGRSVDLVVRRERGVINRSVYWIDVLDPDPARPDDTTHTAWNGRLVYRFGGGCGTTYGQGAPLTSADDPGFLAKGYAVATATFNTFQVQCNDVLSAETLMMVKEHFIEEFGVPVHTIGEGASGGAIQQHLIVQNYPGLLDAITPILPFPDAISIAPGVSDCGLLTRYYASPRGAALTDAQRAAINGHATTGTCALWVGSFLEGIRPRDGCDPGIPPSRVYDPRANPHGLRCDLADANVNQLGRDPKTGFARRPLDNVGVQYGLEALNAGVIGVEEFLDLNAAVGGFDADGNIVPQRERADEESVRIAYAKGRVSEGGGDQKVVPIIDVNVYDDLAGDIHDRFRAFSLRDRLTGRDRRPAPNFVIWTRGGGVHGLGDVLGNIISGGGGAGTDSVAALDEWLDGHTTEPPPGAVDNCLRADGARVSGPDIYDVPGPCRDEYPLHGDPRTAAGAPRRNDILDCARSPVRMSDYRVQFTPEQQSRLRSIFPAGVCDWTRRGIGQVALEGTWLRY